MNRVKDRFFTWFLYACLAWVHIALIFDVFMLVTSYTNPELSTKIGNEIMWKIDGTFNK